MAPGGSTMGQEFEGRQEQLEERACILPTPGNWASWSAFLDCGKCSDLHLNTPKKPGWRGGGAEGQRRGSGQASSPQGFSTHPCIHVQTHQDAAEPRLLTGVHVSPLQELAPCIPALASLWHHREGTGPF